MSATSGGKRRPEAGRVFAAVRSLAFLTLISRVLGFGRDMLMATALGAGAISDAFLLAWTLPNLGRRLFGEGAFAAALVPVFVEAREQGDHAGARRLVNAASTRLILALVALVVLAEGGLGLVRSGAAPGLQASLGLDAEALARHDLTLELCQLLLPYLGFICLAGVLGGALNALDRFAVPAASPLVLNACWIGALLLGERGSLGQVRTLALALLLSGGLQLLLHTRAMGRAGLPVEPTLTADPERLRRVRALFGSLVVGLALFQLNALADNFIAYALVPSGGVSALYYANRLIQLPVGVLGVALATAVFPEMSRMAKRGDTAGMGALLDRGLAVGLFLSIPAAVGLACLAEPVVATLFQRGAFAEDSVARTARAMLLLTPAVVAACVTPVITRAFYAEEEVRTPVRIGAACVALNLLLDLLLVGPLQEAGLALATSVSQVVGLVALVLVSRRRRLARGDRPATAVTLAATGRSLLLATLAGLTALAVQRLVPVPPFPGLLLAVGAAVGVYLGLARALRAPELDIVLSRRRRAAA